MFTREFRAMGSRIFLAMDSEKDLWPELFENVIKKFENWEQSLSRFRSNSELSEFNRNSGQWIQVSPTFWDVLNLAIETNEKTSGIVTPAVLNALEAAGYDVSFEDLPNRTDAWLRQPDLPLDEVKDIELNLSNRSVKVPKGMRLDFGGVAKGWAAQQAMMMLRNTAPVLVDAGGDIAISGPMRDGSAWLVGIADPFNPGEDLEMVMMGSGGIATSGRDFRRWRVNGQWQHHLIDPRILRPAQTDIISATVIGANLIKAEALSKQVLILGSENAVKCFENELSSAYLLVLENGSIIKSDNFKNYRWNEKWMKIQTNLTA
jgi:thiamine biosynthesis lipoprotein